MKDKLPSLYHTQTVFVSIVMPCLNEEKTVGNCVRAAFVGLKKSGLKGEVVVCDNGSIDNSEEKAEEAGARVVLESRQGYGSACLFGIKKALGNWIVLGDSDGTYNFKEIPQFITSLKQGYDLVIGSRMKGKIKENSMPFLNRYLGTPLLNLFLRIFFHLSLSDSQSGLRAFSKKAFSKLKLRTLGMEFASEMLIRAKEKKLNITEVPVSYSPRISPSKLIRFRDGWRHFRFMLLFAPTYLFLLPGFFFLSLGLLGVILLSQGPLVFFPRALDFHSLILASLFVLLGYQLAMLGIYTKTYSFLEGFNSREPLIELTLRYFRLERGLTLGVIISLIGLMIGLANFYHWAVLGFGPLLAVRPAIVSMTLFILGIQIFFSSFFLSILGIERLNKDKK